MTAVPRLLSHDLVLSGAPVPFCLRLWRGGTWQRLAREANDQVTVKQCSGSLLAARAVLKYGTGAQVHRPLGAVAGRRLDRHREGVATYRDGLDGQPRGQHPARRGSRQDRPLPARRASGPVPGTEARDGQQNWQTV